MKKTLSIILALFMMLSAFITLAVPASAEETQGIWDTKLSALTENIAPEQRTPLPGYYYDETGYHTISPDYTNYNPKFTIISKELLNVKNFSMTVVVHDYAVTGDNWLSFSVWTQSTGLAQGDDSAKYGYGWTSIIRPNADGALVNFSSMDQTMSRSGKQKCNELDKPLVFEEQLNDDGDRVVTFSIENGVVKINGLAIGPATDSLIEKTFPEGLAYVGVTIHNTDPSGQYHPTISIIDVNGQIPQGSDSREPEDKSRVFGDMIDADTVPAGQPCIWFDASGEATNPKLPRYSGCEIGYADDNKSILITLENPGFTLHFDVPDNITYNAESFTYAAIIFKNYCGCNIDEGTSLYDGCMGTESFAFWHCAGDVTSARNDSVNASPIFYTIPPIDPETNLPITDDYYTVAIIEITNPLWTGRIHGFRLDIGGLDNVYGKEGRNTLEIMGAGFFKTGTDIALFVESFGDYGFYATDIKIDCLDCTVSGCQDYDGDGMCDYCWDPVSNNVPSSCDHVDEDGDCVCDMCGANIEKNDETSLEEETSATIETEITTTEQTEVTTQPSDDVSSGGCKSSISIGTVALIAILGAGIAIKKKED